MPVKIVFTHLLYDFLLVQRYTHVQMRGIEKKAEAWIKRKGLQEDNYILVPRKMSAMQFEDAKIRFEPIEGSDVKDMLDPPNGIHFLVELPENIAEAFTRFKKG